MLKNKRHSFDIFLLHLLANRKIAPDLLAELVGLQTANRILDNANNWMGIPTLGRGTAAVLHGQLHEFLGAIPDIKAQIADYWEKSQSKNNQEDLQADHRPVYDAPPTKPLSPKF
ncbi:hypothetical protein [Legionella oakridgensis]|uniref:Uncharacterized protein n=2 Tax=Legionella oakridgensis TaxID=29423 RepID=W0B846_9GAMM|nr:hypothetical protein [Legionella oakridgensis]AHE66045.1 hypothetical protein Loa_00468 [Legionella oakridgensis ATCC 33761 = DSM 21215]ETO94195.1 hypothetical protein LOR_22c01900 [Legionella oakridgensis RV-2-2007]KTD43550.1 hypothetical protein Loak_0526 [Legionella oakridgensis]STY15967.1 Uncharacterised protein [Legionella longbeachae]